MKNDNRTDDKLQEQMLEYWHGLDADKLEEMDRRALIKEMSQKFDVSEEMVKQQIAEWEAGKG